MSQHFLLSSASKTLGLSDIFALCEDDAWGMMRQARWPQTGGEPVCPTCGSEAAWPVKSRKQWRCKTCGRTFSVTSGTILADHKLPFRIILAAIFIFSNAAKGISALQLSRDIHVHYRTAYVLAHKLRESLLVQRDETPMRGTVEVDGAYLGGYVRPSNRKEDREDRRMANKPGKACVLVLRQRASDRRAGAARTLTEVVKSETTADVKDFVAGGAIGGTVVHADENPAYDALSAWFDMARVNHSVEYSGKDGECVNLAESYFSRLRRMQWGQIHRLGGRHLAVYANEVAYREDTRRMSNGRIFVDILGKTLTTPTSTFWAGYGRSGVRRPFRPALAA